MTDSFHRPVRLPTSAFEAVQGADDPAVSARRAHETAAALVARVRADPDPAVVARLVGFAEQEGIDAVAELWSRSAPHTLPGALWRLYLLRELIRRDAAGIAVAFDRGVHKLASIDPVVAGAPNPASPIELLAVADQILRGVFEGDLAGALDRAAAFSRVVAAGTVDLADDQDDAAPERATALTTRAARLSQFAAELGASAKLWREGALD